MKQKPRTPQQQKRDERVGFILFILMNLIALGVSGAIYDWRDPVPSQMLPWMVNGGFVLLTFLVRPRITYGYLACLFWLLVASVGFSVIFVASCLVSAVATIIPGLGLLLWPLAWLVLFFYALYRGWGIFWPRFLEWWIIPPSDEDLYFSGGRPSDFQIFRDYQRGNLEIGDDGELRTSEDSDDDQDVKKRRR